MALLLALPGRAPALEMQNAPERLPRQTTSPPPTEVTVLVGGRSVALSGGIHDDSAKLLERALDQAPTATTVVLHSGGGKVSGGLALASLIYKRKLNTYVESYCASACTLALMAGRDRAASPSARIGFHASSASGYGTSKRGQRRQQQETQQANESVRYIYQLLGMPSAFSQRALSTPHEEMWYPSHDELLDAKVLTRRSAGGETPLIATTLRTKEALAEYLSKNALLDALQQHAPERFQQVLDDAWATMAQQGTDAEVIAASRRALQGYLQQSLRLARDETLIEHFSLDMERLVLLWQNDVEGCQKYVLESSGLGKLRHLAPELAQRELTLLTQVIRERDPARAVQLSHEAQLKVLSQAAQSLSKEQLQVLSERRSPAHTASDLCEATIMFMNGFSSHFPPQERGHAIRVLYSLDDVD